MPPNTKGATVLNSMIANESIHCITVPSSRIQSTCNANPQQSARSKKINSSLLMLAITGKVAKQTNEKWYIDVQAKLRVNLKFMSTTKLFIKFSNYNILQSTYIIILFCRMSSTTSILTTG